jgi:hypothetical protein
MTIEAQDLLRYYGHFKCPGCEEAWVIQKFDPGSHLQKAPWRESPQDVIFEGWHPLSSVPLPLQDRAASLQEGRYKQHDIARLRLINIHTGDFIPAYLMV